MTQIQNLSQSLQKHFDFHFSRAKCMAEMIEGVIYSRSPRIHRIAEEFSDKTVSVESHRRRMQNFLQNNKLCNRKVARFISSLLNRKQKLLIAIDRTNWDFGEITHNLLTLAIVIDNIAVPLFIRHLDHPGNSDTEQRIELIKEFIETLGASNPIECITADREFIGEDWIRWLCEQKVPFVIRSRTNIGFKHPNGGKMLAKNWFDQSGEEKSFKTKIEKHSINLTGKYLLESKEFLMVISSLDVIDPLEVYRKRWGIECLFKAMKTSGFNMEDSHIKIKDHFETLTKVLCIAFAIAVKVGLILAEEKPIPVRKTVKSKIVSVARHGLDNTRRFFQNSQRIISIGFASFLGSYKILEVFVT